MGRKRNWGDNLIKTNLELIKDDERLYCIVRDTNKKEIFRGCVSPKFCVSSNLLDCDENFYYTYSKGKSIGVMEGEDYDYLYWLMIREAKTVWENYCNRLTGIDLEIEKLLEEITTKENI